MVLIGAAGRIQEAGRHDVTTVTLLGNGQFVPLAGDLSCEESALLR